MGSSHFRSYPPASTNRARAEAAYAARIRGQRPHPSTREEKDPADVRTPTTAFPCEHFEQGYEHCDRYGVVTDFLGIRTPDECVRREECIRETRKKKALVIGLAAAGIIAGLWIWKKKT